MTPSTFWEAISDPRRFRTWWPWLRELQGDRLEAGGRYGCEIRAPIPYSLRFAVEVVDLVPERSLEAVVSGDLAGPAWLEVEPSDNGGEDSTSVRLAWEMELQRPVLRMAARLGRPVMEWGHDWVVANGVEQFLRRALRVDASHDHDQP